MSTSGAVAGALVLVTVAAARAAFLEGRRAGAATRVVTTAKRPLRLPPAPSWLARRLVDAALPVEPELAWWGWLGASAVTVVAAGALVGPGLAGVVTAVSVAGPLMGWRLLRHRSRAQLEAALPGAVEAIARGLRSGASLRQALAEAARDTPGPLGEDLAVVAGAAERGATPVDSLEEWARRRPIGGVRLVAAALCLGAETGGARAQAVDGVAATLRQRLAAQAEARALATQARASATVIAAAPLVFAVLASATDPRTSTFLFRTPLGLACVTGGLALDAAGALWMARITRSEL